MSMIRLAPVLAVAAALLSALLIHLWSGRASSFSLPADPTKSSLGAANPDSTGRTDGPRPGDHTNVSASKPTVTTGAPPGRHRDAIGPPSPPSFVEAAENDPGNVTVSVSPPDALTADAVEKMVEEALGRLRGDVADATRNPYRKVSPLGAVVKVRSGRVTVWVAWEGARTDGTVDRHRTPIEIGETQ